MLYEVAYYSDFIYINVYSSIHKIYNHCGMSSLPHLRVVIRYEVCKKGKAFNYHRSV